jgi:hypothetical protein
MESASYPSSADSKRSFLQLSSPGTQTMRAPVLQKEFPAVKQPWYADNAGAGGSFTDLRKFFLRLQEIGPLYGYFPEPTKSILVVRSHNLYTAKSAFTDLQFKVTTGSRYLGGYSGSRVNRELWVQEKATFWTSAVNDLAFTALSHRAQDCALRVDS